MKPTLVLLASFYWCSTNMVQAQNTIYGFAVGNWRHGPVVELSPLFTTTESFTTPQLVAWVRQQWPASFTDTTDIDVLRFATVEEGKENRATLHAKYGQRKLAVHLIEAATMPHTAERPEGTSPATGAPR